MNTERAEAKRTALALAPGVLLAGVAGGLALPLLPAVGLEQGMPALVIGAVLAANRVGRLVARPLVGVAADRIGGRALLLWGLLGQLAVMGAYLLGACTAHPAWFFLLGRLLHGPLSAAVFVGAQALALRAGGREHGGLVAGTVKASMALGLPLGGLLGGVLAWVGGPVVGFGAAMAALGLAYGLAHRGAGRTAELPDALPRSRGETKGAVRVSLARVLAAAGEPKLRALGALNFALSFTALGLVLTALPLAMGLANKRASTALMALLVVSMGVTTLVASRRVQAREALVRLCLLGAIGLPLALLGLAAGSVAVSGPAVVVLGSSAGALSASLSSLLSGWAARDEVGAATGWLQLCSDSGGTAGPLVASALLAWGAQATWLSAAVVATAFVPFALGLRPVTSSRPSPSSRTRR